MAWYAGFLDTVAQYGKRQSRHICGGCILDDSDGVRLITIVVGFLCLSQIYSHTLNADVGTASGLSEGYNDICATCV